MAIITLLTSIFKAVPLLKEMWDKIIALYIQNEYEQMKEENKTAIRKALVTHDQREIEKLLNPTQAGQPSGLPGTVIVPSLPNVTDGMPN